MSNNEVEVDDEELRRRKFEEALEVKSLRRIISAYLNPFGPSPAPFPSSNPSSENPSEKRNNKLLTGSIVALSFSDAIFPSTASNPLPMLAKEVAPPALGGKTRPEAADDDMVVQGGVGGGGGWGDDSGGEEAEGCGCEPKGIQIANGGSVSSSRKLLGSAHYILAIAFDFIQIRDAAEEDIKRYERSFRRLPPAHKALLSHLPLKFQRLRWCISKNSFFIFNMLQAFEPPLDMSEDIDSCEHQNSKTAPDHSLFSGKRDACSCQSTSTSGRVSLLKSDEASCGEGCNLTCRSLDVVIVNKEGKTVNFNGHDSGSSAGSKFYKNADRACCNDVKNVNNQATMCSVSDSNGNVSSSHCDWLDPSFQLHVPLVDVDKKRINVKFI
ncbi:carnosine N-methyltransferase [Sarracenia purpurea var. burkii]